MESTMTKRFILIVVGLCSMASATAQEDSFFTDPSLLGPWDQGVFDLAYTDPDILQKAQRYDSVMVDQPEIFIADDSKYKGAKPDHMKQLVDTARLAMTERLERGGWAVADEPGPSVVFMRWAISDLYLKKKKRNILSYTPVGMVVHTTRQAAIRDLWKKVDIVELGLMIEWTDSVSGEVLSAGKAKQGVRKSRGQKEDLVTWEELDAMFLSIGEQTRCHLDNNKLPEGSKRLDCDSIVIEPEV
jgi:hypothetical protein